MVCSLVSIYFDSPNLAYNQNKMLKTLDYWSIDMLNFYFLEKGLGIVSPPHFMYDFSRKMFLILYSFNWPNYQLLLLHEILVNICIAIVCFPGCGDIYFEINLILLIKPFFNITKKSEWKYKYLESNKSFASEIKSIFHHF